MGRHKKVACKICLKAMRSDNIVRHMKKHETKQQGLDEVIEKVDYNSTLNVTALKNNIAGRVNEYQRKLEFGRDIKEFVQEIKAATACLDKE